MSGSRTAIPIPTPSPSPLAAKSSDSDTATSDSKARLSTSTGKWWSSEDLQEQQARSSEVAKSGPGGLSKAAAGTRPAQPTSAPLTLATPQARPSLSPTATLFTPTSFKSANTAALGTSTPGSSPTVATPHDSGFHYNHGTYRSSPSPESFTYPISGDVPPKSASAGPYAAGTVSTERVAPIMVKTSMLAPDEKAKIVQLTSTPSTRTSKAVPIRRPSIVDAASGTSTKPIPGCGEGNAESSAATMPTKEDGCKLDLSAQLADFRPRATVTPSTKLDGHSAKASSQSNLDTEVSRTSPSSSSHTPVPLSPTRESNTSSSHYSTSGPRRSLVPYDLSSEEEESSTETEVAASTPSSTSTEGGGGENDENPSTASAFPPQQSAQSVQEEDDSLEGLVRTAMRSEEEISHMSSPNSLTKTTSSTADKEGDLPVSHSIVNRTGGTDTSAVSSSSEAEGGVASAARENEEAAMKEAVGRAASPLSEHTGRGKVDSTAKEPNHTSESKGTTELSVDRQNEASDQAKADVGSPACPLRLPPVDRLNSPSSFQTFLHADFAQTERSPAVPSGAELETIRSEGVLRATAAQGHTRSDSGGTARESPWTDMPQFNLDQRARSTSFNPFAAPFVPPALPAPFASSPPQQQQPPPPASVGVGFPYGPIAPIGAPALQAFAPADIRYHTTAELLRQALHENGVLHHKVLKYDQVHKTDHDRLHALTAELEQLKQQHTRMRNEARPDPAQQQRIFELNQTILRQNNDFKHLRADLEAARHAVQQAVNDRLAASKRHEEETEYEKRQWKVALQMRDERIDALQAQSRMSEEKLSKVIAEHTAAMAAQSEAGAKQQKQYEDDAAAEVRQQLVAAQPELSLLQTEANAAKAEAASNSAELREVIRQCDNLKQRLCNVEKERDDLRCVKIELEQLKVEHVDLRRGHDGQKEMLDAQGKRLREAVEQKDNMQKELESAKAEAAAAKEEERKVRRARENLSNILRSTHQEKEDSERKYRAELDKVQRELETVAKNFQEAVREIVYVEDERDQANMVAADSFEYAYSGLLSLRRLYEEEQRHTKQLEEDHDTLRSAYTNRLEELGQELKRKNRELEQSRQEGKESERGEQVAQLQLQLSQTTGQRDDALHERDKALLERDKAIKKLEGVREELAEANKRRDKWQAGARLVLEQRNAHEAAEARAQADLAMLRRELAQSEERGKERDKMLEEVKTALEEAKQARKNAIGLSTESTDKIERLKEEKRELEEKARSLEEKVAAVEAELNKLKSSVMLGKRPFVSKTLSVVAADRARGAGV
ncbi:hypothetical protein JCM10908_006854 [Rhodotorula pacifica]|uniref:uncharacterized protein n=1 Tax=Rhodotorula pacifica TaxID=1495444 RepID=UPI00317A01B4